MKMNFKAGVLLVLAALGAQVQAQAASYLLRVPQVGLKPATSSTTPATPGVTTPTTPPSTSTPGAPAPTAPVTPTPAPTPEPEPEPEPEPPKPQDPYLANVSILEHFDTAGSVPLSSGATFNPSAGVFGGGLVFNGNGQATYSASPSATASLDFTVEMWLRTTGVGGKDWAMPIWGSYTLTKFNGGNGSGYGNAAIYTNDLYFEVGAGSGNGQKLVVSRNGQWNNGQWHHIAVSRKGGVLRGFVDGVQHLPSMNASWAYPAVKTVAGVGYTGYLDEVRVTQGVARYIGNFTTPGAPFPDN